jgi:hypothetical protein
VSLGIPSTAGLIAKRSLRIGSDVYGSSSSLRWTLGSVLGAPTSSATPTIGPEDSGGSRGHDGSGVEVRVRRANGELDEAVLSADDLARLLDRQPSATGMVHPVDADKLRLLVESARIRLAYAYDRQFAVSVSGIRTLPHQIEAVYLKMLPQPRLRFLLADDPGAGKTIMAGLLLKEMKLREALERCLILVPAPLTIQWQDELLRFFGESFQIIHAGNDQKKMRLRDYSERGEQEKLGLADPQAGTPAPLVDTSHRALWLMEYRPTRLREFLDQARPDSERLRLVAQALAGTALQGSGEDLAGTATAEQSAVRKLIANWRSVFEESLFSARPA